MSARIYREGVREAPRKTFETPCLIHQEWPEHIARCCAAIRQRKDMQAAEAIRQRRLAETSFRSVKNG